MYARLVMPGSSKELLPYLEHARVVRVRKGLLVSGTEVIFRATKSKVQRYRQTWVCTIDRVPPGDWPPPKGRGTGFDPADDDAIE
jgi:hypothetical protein